MYYNKISIEKFAVEETEKTYRTKGRIFKKDKLDQIWFNLGMTMYSLSDFKETYEYFADAIIKQHKERIQMYQGKIDGLEKLKEDY
jgi:hypothetical protein